MAAPTPSPQASPNTRRVVWALSLAQGVLFAALGGARFTTVHNETFDLAFYSRIAWGLVNRDFWEPMVNAHIYGLHLSPALIPLGWAGSLLGTPAVLIVAQAAALAAAAFPLARIGSRRLGSGGAILGAITWLFYPNLAHVAGYEVHPGALAALPLAWIAWAIDSGRPRALLLGAFGVLCCREDLALIVVLAALVFAYRHRRHWALAAGVGVASLAYAAYFFLVVHPAYAPATGSLQLHFGRFGDSVPEVVLYALSHPLELLSHLSTAERLTYLPRILCPLLFLPLLRASWLVPILPLLAMNLLSEWPTSTAMDVQYLTPAVPFLVAGSLDGLSRARPRLRRRVAFALPVALLVAHVVAGGTPISLDFPLSAFTEDHRSQAARSILRAIPPAASVQAPYPFLAHLAERRRLYRVAQPEAGADYYVLDLEHRRRFAAREDLLRTVEEPPARDWLARADHAVVAAVGDFLLLARGRDPRTGLGAAAILGRADPGRGVRIAACLRVAGARLRDDLLLLDLIASAPCPADLALRIGTERRPRRVDLLFGGWLSPVHLRRGDRLVSAHRVAEGLGRDLRSRGLRVGALRQSGARPEHADPVSIEVPLSR